MARRRKPPARTRQYPPALSRAAQRAWDSTYPACAKARRADRRYRQLMAFFNWCHKNRGLVVVAYRGPFDFMSVVPLVDDYLGIDREAVKAEIKAMRRDIAEREAEEAKAP